MTTAQPCTDYLCKFLLHLRTNKVQWSLHVAGALQYRIVCSWFPNTLVLQFQRPLQSHSRSIPLPAAMHGGKLQVTKHIIYYICTNSVFHKAVTRWCGSIIGQSTSSTSPEAAFVMGSWTYWIAFFTARSCRTSTRYASSSLFARPLQRAWTFKIRYWCMAQCKNMHGCTSTGSNRTSLPSVLPARDALHLSPLQQLSWWTKKVQEMRTDIAVDTCRPLVQICSKLICCTCMQAHIHSMDINIASLLLNAMSCKHGLRNSFLLLKLASSGKLPKFECK